MKINRIEKDGKVSYSVEGFSSAEIGKRLKEALRRMSWKRYFKRNPKKNRKRAKNVDDYKIKLSWEGTGAYRYYYYKIVPSELPLFQRWFKNPWHRINLACLDDWNPNISIKDYKEYIAPLRTYGDVRRLRENEWSKIKATRKRYEEHNIRWPD